MSITVRIVDGPIGTDALASVEAASDGGCGARATFEGIVRRLEQGRAIRAIAYELYRPMTDHELIRLAQGAAVEFGLERIAVVHSAGRVPVGACSFRMVVEAPRRAAALDAMTHFIDRMKREVPIWKRIEWAE